LGDSNESVQQALAAKAHGADMDKPKALVVEDEFLLLTVVEEELIDAGFEVETASSGSEAVAKLERSSEAITCLLTDIRLGEGIDGWEVARRARALKPKMPVVYMTGDSAVNWAANGVPQSVLLGKPFALSQLTTAVSQLINDAPPPKSSL
jgi:CheY-like chemotaxis protein